MENYEKLERLGGGGGGEVFRGRKAGGMMVALKVLRAPFKQSMRNEFDLVSRLDHPNIVKMLEIVLSSESVVIVMELIAGNNLRGLLKSKGALTLSAAQTVFRQVVEAVAYLHSHGIVHRDIKVDNVMLENSGSVKLVDFGLSNTYKQSELLKTACGSPCYAAPEMIAGKKYHGTNVDIWSCGVILFALICGYLPFEDPNTS